MATLDNSGRILPGVNEQPYTVGQQQNPYNTYVSNLGNLLSYVTAKSQAGNTAIQQNVEGLQRGQANLATPGGAGNPLNSLYSFIPGSAQTEVSKSLGNIMEPSILSNQGQAKVGLDTANTLATQTKTMGDQAIAQMNAGIGRYSTFIDPNTNQVYSFDS